MNNEFNYRSRRSRPDSKLSLLEQRRRTRSPEDKKPREPDAWFQALLQRTIDGLVAMHLDKFESERHAEPLPGCENLSGKWSLGNVFCRWVADNRIKSPIIMNLYVGNFSFDMTERTLRELFEPFGTVSEVKLIMDRETGQSRGFGFVTMGNVSEGKAAIKGLDGKDKGGRKLTVNEARPKDDRGGRSSPGSRR